MIVRVSAKNSTGSVVRRDVYNLSHFGAFADLTLTIRRDMDEFFSQIGEYMAGNFKVESIYNEFSERDFTDIFTLEEFFLISKRVYETKSIPRKALPEMLADKIYPRASIKYNAHEYYDRYYLGEDRFEMIETYLSGRVGDGHILPIKSHSPAEVLLHLTKIQYFINSGPYYFVNPNMRDLRKIA